MSSNFCPVTDRQTDRQTESDAYEPSVQCAQVGSMKTVTFKSGRAYKFTICCKNGPRNQLSIALDEWYRYTGNLWENSMEYPSMVVKLLGGP